MMTLDFAVMSGAGNIFTVIDNRLYRLTVDDGRRLAPLLCSADVAGRVTEGLMLISPSVQPGIDFHMDFFNPDGSYGAMCGNGGRCAVHFALEAGMVQSHGQLPTTFTVLDTVYKAHPEGASIRLEFPPAREVRIPCSIVLDGVSVPGAYVNVGSDHFVVDFADIVRLTGGDFHSFDINLWGARIRHHKDFAPQGVNANFYSLQPDSSARLRTFERGVEAETGACGTGAIATALAIARCHGIAPPLRIIPTSGDMLIVDILQSHLSLQGPAVILDRRTADIAQP